MKILSAAQIREADQYTIEHEPISSLDLMERASNAFVECFEEIFEEKSHVHIFCGTGNNGGDGLAIGRILLERGWKVHCYVLGDREKGSPDFSANLERISEVSDVGDLPQIGLEDIVIDGLFGSGLSRELASAAANLIAGLNRLDCQKVAIDISSGLFADKPISDEAVAFEADHTISFQLPKMAFVMPSYHRYVGEWHVVDIGLDEQYIADQKSDYHYTTYAEMQAMVPGRETFAHKSQMGHLLVVAGSRGKMGAAALCASAALRTGVGLINIHTASCGTDVLQILVPEAMVDPDQETEVVSDIVASGQTIAIGPGLGTDDQTAGALKKLLDAETRPMVFDADALNIIATHSLLDRLPKGSILTPHPGEFRRLVGEWADDFERLQKLRELCTGYKVNVVLKGAFSAVCNSEGLIFFNPSGNPGMATAGSGDVLTGMIGSLLAQGLDPQNALRLGVYLHGVSGDLAAADLGQNSLIASDIISQISNSFATLGV